MRPAFIDDMSWEMAEVYGAITDQILINLARHFPYFKPENLPGSAFAYQADMLAQMGQVNRESVRIIRNGLKNADDALQRCLEQAIIDSIKSVNPALYKAAKAGILKMPTSIVTAPNQMRAFQLYYQQAAQKLNLVNTVMLESTKQAYQATVADIVNRVQATQTALDIGAGEVVTGVSSWNQAMVHSINRMKANGITGFIDHGGHRWSAEAYTAMDIRTTMANTARAAVWETNQDFGNDLYSVSYHDGARPLCYPWQNKVISSLDRSGVTYDLDGNEIPIYPQSSTSYGQPAGLFGINCKHYPTPFIPGVSLIRGQPMSEEANKQAYEDSQKQRALERKIREEKRDLMMLKAQGAPDDVIKAQRAKIRQTDDDIDNFCAETGRARRQNREGVYTERKFPSADTYDVTQFERSQKELIDKYFENGGVQQEYTFGQMTPNEPITPVTPTPAAPVVNNAPVQETPQGTFTPAKTREEAEAYAMEHFGNKYSTMSYKGIDLDYANTCNRVLTEVNEKFEVPALKGVQPMNMRTNMFKGSTAEAAYHWGGDGTLYINPTYYKSAKAYAAHKAQIDELTKTCLEGGQTLLDSGKYTGKERTYLETLLRTGRQCVSQSHDFVEGSFVHESGHMLDSKLFRKAYDGVFGTTGVFEGYANYISESRMIYGINISGYAVSSNAEYIAESFTAWWYGETEILDPKIIQVFESVMKQ